jgi:hypothetical protein
VNEVYFIRKGECNVLADYELDGEEGMIKVGKFQYSNYFGQEAALEPGTKSRFTIVAGYKVN